jgi:hypothetical protein
MQGKQQGEYTNNKKKEFEVLGLPYQGWNHTNATSSLSLSLSL